MKKKSTLGLFEATPEGLSAERSYVTPAIKVVAFNVEEGFRTTMLNIGDRTITDEHPEETEGTELFGTETWAARPFSN